MWIYASRFDFVTFVGYLDKKLMSKYLILLLLFLTKTTFGQDTTYFDAEWNKTNAVKYAQYYKITLKDTIDTTKYLEIEYNIKGQIRAEDYYSKIDGKPVLYKTKNWHINGQLKNQINYKNQVFNGKVLTFWENGKPKRIDNFINGKLIDGKCFNVEGIEITHFDFEIMPEYLGGVSELMKNYFNKSMQYE